MIDTTENETPQRNHVVTIVIGADDVESVMRAVKFLETDFYLHGVRGHILGGPDYGLTVDVQINEEVTHESYFAAVDDFLRREKDESHD